jgi:hypothetical protein
MGSKVYLVENPKSTSYQAERRQADRLLSNSHDHLEWTEERRPSITRE